MRGGDVPTSEGREAEDVSRDDTLETLELTREALERHSLRDRLIGASHDYHRAPNFLDIN
jgi:hypothetical protein